MSERTKKIMQLAQQAILTKQRFVSLRQPIDNGPNESVQEVEKQQNVVNQGASTSKECELSSPSDENIHGSDESNPFSDNSEIDKNYEPSDTESSSTESFYESFIAATDDITMGSEDIDNNDNIIQTDDNNEINQNDPSVWQNICNSTPMDFNFYEENFSVCDEIRNSEIRTPIDVYKYFVTKELLELIVVETNRYANQQICNIHSRKSRTKSWVNTNEAEIMKFLGLNIAMGLVQNPTINSYWSKDSLYHCEFIASCMTRDRFLLLLKFMHFCDNETADTTNRLYKIEPAVSILLQNFQKSVSLGKVLVIDESMVPFRGRLIFRQYIPNKSHRYGVKIYKLCADNGYTYNVRIYCGKGDTDLALGHSQSVVLKLLNKVDQKKGRILYADNFYSSIPLVEKLLSFDMLYCGTLRSNRKGIPRTFDRKLKKSEVFAMQKDNIKIIKWVDKRPVLMISSDPTHDDKLISIGRKNKKGEEVLKPKCITDYNKAKKGVDYSDQMSSYHSAVRRNLKWYRKVMFELILGSAVVNSWILYNMLSSTKLGITEFRRSLAEDLVGCEIVETGASSSKKRVHTFVRPEGPGRKKKKPCKGCYANLRKTLSSRQATLKTRHVISYCQDCEKQPGFCLTCFNNYHK